MTCICLFDQLIITHLPVNKKIENPTQHSRSNHSDGGQTRHFFITYKDGSPWNRLYT